MSENSVPEDTAGLPRTLPDDRQAQQLLSQTAACFESLQNVSQAILNLGDNPDIETLESLVHQRARLVESLYSVNLSLLSDEDKAPLAMHLANCGELDRQVEACLGAILSRMGNRLNTQHQSRHIMGTYRTGKSESVTTREDDA